VRPLRRLYSTFAGGWPGAGLLILRIVVGCALVVRASWRLWGEAPMNEAVTAVLLMGAGCLLIVGLWTSVAGSAVAVTEIWKMLTMPGERWLWLLLGNHGCRHRDARARIMVAGRSSLWLDARRSSASQEVDSGLLEILPQSKQSLTQKKREIRW